MKTNFYGESYVKDVAVLNFQPVKSDSRLYYRYREAFELFLEHNGIDYDDIVPRQCLKGDYLDGFIAYTYEIKIHD